MNAVIDLIAQTNRMLDKATTQADKLQVAQFERLKAQFVGQLVELIGANRQPIEVARKGVSRKDYH